MQVSPNSALTARRTDRTGARDSEARRMPTASRAASTPMMTSRVSRSRARSPFSIRLLTRRWAVGLGRPSVVPMVLTASGPEADATSSRIAKVRSVAAAFGLAASSGTLAVAVAVAASGVGVLRVFKVRLPWRFHRLIE
ncbi:protein of unknown function (plasmid) [Azospirillum baldaniorum]|uniref:Uncharacterized protein n=1 Tax=Azospirillum baldaniorum TaxID=1064539 RepID=A0A9P1K1B2_9PROT|nr:protein of unknown function [Azospirillum baldaniorum]